MREKHWPHEPTVLLGVHIAFLECLLDIENIAIAYDLGHNLHKVA